nr:MMPL family transporter [uncultured Capnocytophaga sp.]
MLNRIYQYIRGHKLATFSFFGAWALIAIYGLSRLRFEEDITKVLPQNEKTNLTSKVLKQLNFADKISVMITVSPKGNLKEMQEVAEALRDSISASMGKYITGIQGIVGEEEMEGTWQFVNEHLPLFLTDEDYVYLEKRLATDSLRAMVESHYKTMMTPAGMVAQQYIRRDPFGLTFRGMRKLQELSTGTDFRIENGFLTTNDGRHILFFINPKYDGNDSEHNAAFVAQLDALQDHFNVAYKERVRVDFFGAPFISVSNATQIKTDILTTVLISLSVLYLLLVFFYRSVYIPFIAFIPSAFGVLSALAFLYVLKGSISAISISLGAVLLGVTIDYSLHILTHYKVAKNTVELYRAVTVPILLSSITTAISFLCLLFVHSEVMRDLGIFAFIGIMVSALLSLVLIPHFYRGNRTIEVRKTFLDSVAAYPFHQNRWLVGGSLALIIVSFFTFKNVSFNGDIANINYINERYQVAQRQLENITDSEYKSVYATAYGNSLEEALGRNYTLYKHLQGLRAQDSIKQFSSIGGIVLPKSEQEVRLRRWEDFWADRSHHLQHSLIALGKGVGFKESTYVPFYESLSGGFEVIEDLDTYKSLSAIPLEDFITEKDGFYTIANLVKLTAGERTSFIHKIEKETPTIVIDRKNLSETFLGKLKDDILLLVNYSSIAIFVILLLFFKRIELVLLTLIPIGVTGVVTSALMNFLGIEFNVFSMIVCTLVLGHSVDFSIFMTCALQKDYTDGKDELPVYKVSVLLASITTFLAIGTLIFAKHPALKSIASVSVIGIFSALAITFVFYPTIFKFFIFRRPQRGLSPVSLRLVVQSIFLISYYALSSVLLSNIGWLLVKLTPRRTLWLRKLASKLTTSVLYANPFVQKRVENPTGQKLLSPSVVISNHSSWLDTLIIGLFTHRISYMVNDWVYRSVVFGRYVRAMGFFPASEGIEKGMPLFEGNLKQGISLMLFPEGKRSESNQIHRFHKGAFVLSEKFSVPIVPVYIHGASEVQPKGDFIIYDGALTIHIGESIAFDDSRFGETARERAKQIGGYFRNTFLALRRRLEGIDYLKKKLFLSYLYKAPYVVEAVKATYKEHRERYWELVHSLPEKARILHIANDYGQLDFLLLLTYPEREVVSVIADDEKRAIASQSYITKIRKLKYVKSIDDELAKGDFEAVIDEF